MYPFCYNTVNLMNAFSQYGLGIPKSMLGDAFVFNGSGKDIVKKINACERSQSEAAAIAKGLRHAANVADGISGVSGTLDGVSIVGEIPSGGADTPATVSLTSITLYFGAAGTVLSNASGALYSYSQGNMSAVNTTLESSVADMIVSGAAAKIPFVNNFKDAFGSLAAKGMELTKDGKKACQSID